MRTGLKIKDNFALFDPIRFKGWMGEMSKFFVLDLGSNFRYTFEGVRSALREILVANKQSSKIGLPHT